MNYIKSTLYAGLLLCLFFLTACGDGPEPVPANVVNSTNGLRIDLEWTTGGTTSDAVNNSDLDLYLTKGGTEVSNSTSSGSFEVVRIQDVYADGEYTIAVEAFNATKKTNYTLYVKGDDEGELKPYTGEFLAGDRYLKVNFLKIKKAGSTYTITEY
ncbi:hypothetical protein [Cesiribacter andamanensis]|uniref:Uncharacterized protein n=1 Tax=Cesiribacter andamanensis AMV16 TaxID=1279009 RepID=M7MZ81_9BACT|nr:hypothetical protein [Cesiribacter andamanensis]EMR01743.1 hypothetical protein ADICEAN_03139 [Cesiribacter andamanensis AMV16]